MTAPTAPAPLPPWEDTARQVAMADRDWFDRDYDTEEDNE